MMLEKISTCLKSPSFKLNQSEIELLIYFIEIALKTRAAHLDFTYDKW